MDIVSILIALKTLVKVSLEILVLVIAIAILDHDIVPLVFVLGHHHGVIAKLVLIVKMGIIAWGLYVLLLDKL